MGGDQGGNNDGLDGQNGTLFAMKNGLFNANVG